MSHANWSTRILAVALIASTGLLTIAPVAEAGHHGRGRARGHHASSQTVVVYRSSPAPILAGIVGGFILGSAYAARSAPVVHTVAYEPAPRYRYWDPYCDTWFVSLSSCREHSYHEGHAQIVKVYDYDGGPCVRTMQWSAGAWCDI